MPFFTNIYRWFQHAKGLKLAPFKSVPFFKINLSPFFLESTLGARRDLIQQRLDRVPHVFDYVKPEGAYYVFPRIKADHEDSFEFSLNLLKRAKVAVTPGSAFGPAGEHHVRMAFCVSEEVINRSFDRIEEFFGR